MLVVFCIAIMTIVGIVSVTVYFSKDPVHFSIKLYSKLLPKSESGFSIVVTKKAKKENK